MRRNYRIISGLLLVFLLSNIICQSSLSIQTFAEETIAMNSYEDLKEIEKSLYETLLLESKSGEFSVEKVESVYISEEYLAEIEYNSKSNIFFGMDLKTLEDQFKKEKFVLTTDDNGKTIAKAFKENSGNDFLTILKKTAATAGAGIGIIALTVLVGKSTLPLKIYVFVNALASTKSREDIVLFLNRVFVLYRSGGLDDIASVMNDFKEGNLNFSALGGAVYKIGQVIP